MSSIPHLLHRFSTKQDPPPPFPVITAKQVHGSQVLFLHEHPPASTEGFDILMTDQPDMAIGVQTADCLPILLVETKLGLIATIHAGWRGTLAGVCHQAVLELTRVGGSVENLCAALGPTIGPDCYEVGADVALPFQEKFSDFTTFLVKKRREKWLLNLTEANRRQLLRLGLKSEKIDLVNLCTHCHPDLFYSYRREGARTGRMTHFIRLASSKQAQRKESR